MCEPTIAIMAVTTAVSAYGQMQQASAQADALRVQGENQRRIAEYNAQIQENNATIAERNSERAEERAVDAIRRGANEAATVRDRIRRINATGRATQGSSGLLVEGGNFADVMDQNLVFGEMDALTQINNAEREAYGYKTDAYNFEVDAMNLNAQADLTRAGGQAAFDAKRMSANNVKQAGRLAATDTLLSGATNVAGQFGGGSSASRTTTLNSGEVITWNSRRRRF